MLLRKRFTSVMKVLLPALLIFIAILLISQSTNNAANVPTVAVRQKNNPTIVENIKKGTTNWQLTNPASKKEIEGYASSTSVNRGEEIQFFVNTKEPAYKIEIFRMGWYGGAGGRQMAAAITRKGVKQPAPTIDQVTGLIECDWNQPYVLKIPDEPQDATEWASGFYLAKLTTSKTGKQSYIIFVVRDDSRVSDILFQSSVTTYQAYNNWGAMSLYRWNSRGRQAYKVSFNRPYAASPNLAAAYGMGAGEFLTNSQPRRRTSSAGWEYNMVRWLEKQGYDVSYSTDVDTHENYLDEQSGKHILSLHKAFLSVGHDEYWSWQMRQNVEEARDNGVSLGFFSANTCYWQIRFEPSKVTGDINRTIVGYKENAALDPYARDDNSDNDYLITTLWRNKPIKRPEDSLIGVMYETFQVNTDIIITNKAPEWILADTQFSYDNRQKQIFLTGLLGYEVDRMFGNAPDNIVRIAHSPYPHGRGLRYSDVTLYTTDHAIVFATGSMQWIWGLDNYNAPRLRPPLANTDAQAITRNVLNRMVSKANT